MSLEFGCIPKRRETTKRDQKPKGHVLSKEQVKEILKDVKEDIEILSKVRADPAPLKKALAKKALEDFTNFVNKGVAEGKVKVRRFKNINLALKNYSGGIVGVSLSYLDQSYYEDKDGKQLSKPTDTPTRYILAVQKIKGRWKIVAFYSPEVKTTPQGKE